LLKDDEIVEFNDWDEEIGNYGKITGRKGCGENRYVSVANIFEFYLKAGCEIKIIPRDAI